MGRPELEVTHPDTGEVKTASEWAKFLGIRKMTFLLRHNKHGPSNPKTWAKARGLRRIKNPITGETFTFKEWGELLGISGLTLRARIKSWGVSDPRTWKPPAYFSDEKLRELNALKDKPKVESFIEPLPVTVMVYKKKSNHELRKMMDNEWTEKFFV